MANIKVDGIKKQQNWQTTHALARWQIIGQVYLNNNMRSYKNK